MKFFYSVLAFFFAFSFSINLFGQEVDIIPYLKQIERGESESVRKILPELKKENPKSANLIFLEAVLTENGQDAVSIYKEFVEKYPNNSYADAALYRIYSYYYALGLYETATKVISDLTTKYPESPYIKMAKSQEESVEQESSGTADENNEQNINKNEKFRFTIQAGAFINSENARKLKNELGEDGINCEIKEKNVGGTIFNVVYAGKFNSRADAEKFLKKINSEYNLNGRIVETENQ